MWGSTDCGVNYCCCFFIVALGGKHLSVELAQFGRLEPENQNPRGPWTQGTCLASTGSLARPCFTYYVPCRFFPPSFFSFPLFKAKPKVGYQATRADGWMVLAKWYFNWSTGETGWNYSYNKCTLTIVGKKHARVMGVQSWIKVLCMRKLWIQPEVLPF